MIQLSKVKFEDEYFDSEYGMMTLYFTAPNDRFENADSMEISLEFPAGIMEASETTCMISPTKDGSDYDWSDIDLSDDTIEKLFDIYRKDVIKC